VQVLNPRLIKAFPQHTPHPGLFLVSVPYCLWL